MIDEELVRLKKFIERNIDTCKYKNKKFQKLKELSKEVDQNPHKTQPNTPNLCKVSSVNETAFQRAVFNTKTSRLRFTNGDEKEVNWLDLELPVTFKLKTPRRKCVDLIGKLNDKPFICELKYRKESKGYSGDPPEYGFFELLTYFYLLSCKPKELHEEGVYRKIENRDKFKWSDINKTKFMLLAANKSYWESWEKNKQDILKLVEEAKKELEIEIYLFETENVDFENQKGNKSCYMPSMINKIIWTQIKK